MQRDVITSFSFFFSYDKYVVIVYDLEMGKKNILKEKRSKLAPLQDDAHLF